MLVCEENTIQIGVGESLSPTYYVRGARKYAMNDSAHIHTKLNLIWMRVLRPLRNSVSIRLTRYCGSEELDFQFVLVV